MDALAASPADLSRLTEMETVVQLAISLAFELDLWKVQNRYWQILQTVYPASLSATDQASREWITHFAALGNLLGVKLGITEPAEIRLAA